jgi:hypothetical protein
MAEAERFLLMCILSLHLKEKKQVNEPGGCTRRGGFGDKGTAVHTHKSAQAYDTEHHIPSSRCGGDKVIVVYRHCTFDAFGTFYAHRIIIAIVSRNATGEQTN